MRRCFEVAELANGPLKRAGVCFLGTGLARLLFGILTLATVRVRVLLHSVRFEVELRLELSKSKSCHSVHGDHETPSLPSIIGISRLP